MIFHVRPIPSCPGYFVSDTGRVWGPRKELKPYLWRRYLVFHPSRNGKQPTVRVAHAVAEAFLGPKPPGAWVCHRNDVATDNRAENLYYGNRKTNTQDAFRNARLGWGPERNPQAKLTWEAVADIRRDYAAGGVTQKQLAKNYGVCPRVIWYVVNHKRWVAAPQPH